ncbi:hypothetical protein [Actinokineospora globicatena]|uniref:Pentapeptide repeat-containing protein n=1 Tax=Actinokineospora globicatena TaxID=103729 RepID=A0A9W6QPB9_9PSEU|nr:hypothetical protein [Actinokineospora globicatena]MCP2306118.1 hypothetical protein [Actinokineospora globicatena]GLW80007.1 hypothetical protein Aglo01_44880 [Actinokineospora globicatena]GLW86836.1 hypothetical protein Aglo02_44750 [Actinokineospora globicatena]GLW93222.1 hypothetical protein Aglo03_40380 [Actinokineospora globicatena]
MSSAKSLSLSGSHVEESFAGLDLDYFNGLAARFDRCSFDKIRIRQACFGAGVDDTEYVDCTFDGAHIGALSPGVARFERCTFRDSRLVKWLCDTVEFIDCVFTGRISETNFAGAISPMNARLVGRTVNRFEGNDFSDATLVWVGFRGGIDLLDQKLPTSGAFLVEDGDVVVPRMIALAEAWPESRAKVQVVSFLESLLFKLRNGQRHVLFTAATWAGKTYAGLDIYDRIVELAHLAST